MGAVTIGLDVGQRRDPTAICVAETEGRTIVDDRREIHHLVRHLERLPLGTSYPDVAARVAAVVAGVVAKAGGQPELYIDATGVGTALVDILKETGMQAILWPVYFTHGDRRSVEGGEVKLGKAWLVSRLQVLMQSGRLHLPRSAESDALAREFLDYEIRIGEQANDTYGAFRTGAHDDLVTALGLAVQLDRESYDDCLPVVDELWQMNPWETRGG